MERDVAFCGRDSQPWPRKARKPLAGHYDPCCQELAARASEEMPKPETRTRAENRHGVERREARRPDRKERS